MFRPRLVAVGDVRCAGWGQGRAGCAALPETPTVLSVVTASRSGLNTVAEAAIEELVEHGVDALEVELVLAMLHDARELDQP